LINIVKELGDDKLIILGCGLKNDDALSKFKKYLSNETFTYTIYKNIFTYCCCLVCSCLDDVPLHFPPKEVPPKGR
jgi:hypothetical protein